MAIEDEKTAFHPSRNGFHFPNDFGTIEILGSPFPMGLCGGMVWSALDRYYGHVPDPIPAQRDPPPAGSPLREAIFRRQIDSLRVGSSGSAVLIKVLDWQLRPDTGHPTDRHSVGHLTQTEEWPAVKKRLDRGIPVPLCLVRKRGTGNPAENHQVLATGYRYSKSDREVSIPIYDPNHPDDESVRLSIKLGQPDSQLSASQSTGEPLRGFFALAYDRKERKVPLPPEADVSWWVVLSGPPQPSG